MRKATGLHPGFQRPKRIRRLHAVLEEERGTWLAPLGAASPSQPLCDHLPGVGFFAKDRRGRTMFAIRGILDCYRVRHVRERLGLTDYDIDPSHMAEHSVQHDRRLLSGRERMIDRLEL